MKTEKIKRSCANCGSINIFLYTGSRTGMKYQCNDCGYVGPLVSEANARKKVKTRKRVL